MKLRELRHERQEKTKRKKGKKEDIIYKIQKEKERNGKSVRLSLGTVEDHHYGYFYDVFSCDKDLYIIYE